MRAKALGPRVAANIQGVRGTRSDCRSPTGTYLQSGSRCCRRSPRKAFCAPWTRYLQCCPRFSRRSRRDGQRTPMASERPGGRDVFPMAVLGPVRLPGQVSLSGGWARAGRTAASRPSSAAPGADVELDDARLPRRNKKGGLPRVWWSPESTDIWAARQPTTGLRLPSEFTTGSIDRNSL
jgi:hypothetical protein